MAKPKNTPRGEKKILDLTGNLTIDGVETLKASLVKSLNDSAHVHIRMDLVTDISLPVLQLLCSAHRTAVEQGKSLTLGEIPPEAFYRAVEAAGLSRHAGCFPDSPDSCLWKDGGRE